MAVAGIDTQDSTERMLTRAPPPFAATTGAKAWLTASMPKTLVSISRRPASMAPAPRTPVEVPMPALLMTRVTSSHSRAAASMSAGTVTSRRTAMAPLVSTLAGSRSPAYTLAAPASRRHSAKARPRPRLAPVTRATDP